MKRLLAFGFLGFLILGLPLLFTACFPGSCNGKKTSSFVTYASIRTVFLQPNLQDSYLENDSISEDTINGSLFMETLFFTNHEKVNRSNPYAAMACDPVFPQPKNKLVKMQFGLITNGNVTQIDTTISSSLVLNIQGQVFNWSQSRDLALSNLRSENMPSVMRYKFKSTHSKQPVQLIVWALKESGDTLKGITPIAVFK
jgi:hypothetical protein